MIKAALNGGRTKAEHECVPTSPSEIAHAARDAVEAGAAAVHIHVRDTAGAESLHADDVAQTLNAVREFCPGIPVGISTGAWIVPDLAERGETIGSWTILPDFVFRSGSNEITAYRIVEEASGPVLHPLSVRR